MTYRADHVGSLLRPPELLAARRAQAEGRLPLDELRRLEDVAILQALEMQRAAGIDVLSDGQYRRGGWSEAWTNSLEGLVPNEGPVAGLTASWRGGYLDVEPQHTSSVTSVQAPGAMAPPGRLIVGNLLRRKQRLTAPAASGPVLNTGGLQRATVSFRASASLGA